jgi:hypothetical protein
MIQNFSMRKIVEVEGLSLRRLGHQRLGQEDAGVFGAENQAQVLLFALGGLDGPGAAGDDGGEPVLGGHLHGLQRDVGVGRDRAGGGGLEAEAEAVKLGDLLDVGFLGPVFIAGGGVFGDVAGQRLALLLGPVLQLNHQQLLAPKLESPAHPKIREELQFLDQACAYL